MKYYDFAMYTSYLVLFCCQYGQTRGQIYIHIKNGHCFWRRKSNLIAIGVNDKPPLCNVCNKIILSRNELDELSNLMKLGGVSPVEMWLQQNHWESKQDGH